MNEYSYNFLKFLILGLFVTFMKNKISYFNIINKFVLLFIWRVKRREYWYELSNPYQYL